MKLKDTLTAIVMLAGLLLVSCKSSEEKNADALYEQKGKIIHHVKQTVDLVHSVAELDGTPTIRWIVEGMSNVKQVNDDNTFSFDIDCTWVHDSTGVTGKGIMPYIVRTFEDGDKEGKVDLESLIADKERESVTEKQLETFYQKVREEVIKQTLTDGELLRALQSGMIIEPIEGDYTSMFTMTAKEINNIEIKDDHVKFQLKLTLNHKLATSVSANTGHQCRVELVNDSSEVDLDTLTIIESGKYYEQYKKDVEKFWVKVAEEITIEEEFSNKQTKAFVDEPEKRVKRVGESDRPFVGKWLIGDFYILFNEDGTGERYIGIGGIQPFKWTVQGKDLDIRLPNSENTKWIMRYDIKGNKLILDDLGPNGAVSIGNESHWERADAVTKAPSKPREEVGETTTKPKYGVVEVDTKKDLTNLITPITNAVIKKDFVSGKWMSLNDFSEDNLEYKTSGIDPKSLKEVVRNVGVYAEEYRAVIEFDVLVRWEVKSTRKSTYQRITAYVPITVDTKEVVADQVSIFLSNDTNAAEEQKIIDWVKAQGQILK